MKHIYEDSFNIQLYSIVPRCDGYNLRVLATYDIRPMLALCWLFRTSVHLRDLCRSAIRVMQATQDGDGDHRSSHPRWERGCRRLGGDSLLQALMRPVFVDVGDVLREDTAQEPIADHMSRAAS